MKGKRASKKVTFVFIILLITVVFMALSWRVWQSYQDRIWDYPGRLNLLESEGLTLISIPNTSADLLEIKLPQEAYVTVWGGYGDYKFEDVKELGESEGGRGEEFLEKTVSQLLGIPVDGNFHDLTFWDKIKIFLKKRGVARVKKIELSSLPVFLEKERGDGSKIKKIDPEKIDFYLGEIFWEKVLREENLKIGIFNASSETGLANEAARLLENIGGHIIEVANWQETVDICQTRTQEKFRQTATLRRLAKIFPCKIIFADIPERFDVLLLMKSL